MRTLKNVLAALAISLTASTAWASASTGTPVWNIQNTGISGNQATALGLRADLTWPVIVTDAGGIYSIFPTDSGSMTPGHWYQIGSSPAVNGQLFAASSPHGRVAVVGGQSLSSHVGEVSGTTGGWIPLSNDTTAVTFDSHGNLLTGDVYGDVSGVSNPPAVTQPIDSIAADPLGDIAITSGGQFSEYSPWIGWASSSRFTEARQVVLDSRGRPYVWDAGARQIFSFDPQTGDWTAGPATPPANLTMAAAANGTVGAAWTNQNSLIYAYKSDGGTWTQTIVASNVRDAQSVGLAYDYLNQPVLSYISNDTGNVMLAYDPAATPEPASLCLLLIGAAAWLLPRRRSAA